MSAYAYPAVIADARAIQHRRRVRLTLLALVLVAAGAAFVLYPRHHAATPIVTIRVYASPVDVQRVAAVTHAQSGLVSTRYVSAAQALAVMRRRAPRLVQGLRSNPLPAAFILRVRTSDAAAARRQLVERLGTAAQAVILAR